jgi:hypothetical protein
MSSEKSLDVRRSKSTLVAVFAKANPPLIWNFDLTNQQNFALALQAKGDDWELGVMSPKREFQPVACFPLRKDADEAFLRVGKVLAKGRFGWMVSFVKGLGIVFLVLIALRLTALTLEEFQDYAITRAQLALAVAKASPLSQAAPAPQPQQNGVPLPADEALKPPIP